MPCLAWYWNWSSVRTVDLVHRASKEGRVKCVWYVTCVVWYVTCVCVCVMCVLYGMCVHMCCVTCVHVCVCVCMYTLSTQLVVHKSHT